MKKAEKLEKARQLMESMAQLKARHEKVKLAEAKVSPTRIGKLMESELERAELILAAKDFLAKIQKMGEDVAQIIADMIPLTDGMKGTFGPDVAGAFDTAVNEALQGALKELRSTADKISTGILKVEGKIEPGIDNDMAADDGGDLEVEADDSEADEDLDADEKEIADAFGAAEQEPLGRVRKESFENRRTPLRESGEALLKRESLQSLVGWLFETASASMEADKFASFAQKVTAMAAEDSAKLAGWIGKKKYGPGAMAQLSNPLQGLNPEDLVEGKSYRFDTEDDDDYQELKKAARDTRRARKEKYTIEEAKADAIAEGILNNLREFGKGKAALVVEDVFNDDVLVESEEQFDRSEVLRVFESKYGTTPVRFSLTITKYLEEANIPLSKADKEVAAGVISNIASKATTDRNFNQKSVNQALQGLDSKQRNTTQKIINKAKQTGRTVNKVQDLVDVANKELSESNEEDPNGGYVGKVEAYGVMGVKSKPFRKVFKNGAAFLKWYEKNEGNVDVQGVRDRVDESSESKDPQGDDYKKWRKENFNDRETTRKLISVDNGRKSEDR